MQTYEATPNIDTVSDLLSNTGFTVHDVIPQYVVHGPDCEPWDSACLEMQQDYVSVPVYGRTTFDRALNQEIYPVVKEVQVDPFTLTMPPLAQQWRQDWRDRINRAAHRGVTIYQGRMRAPEEFIKTGVWPKDEPRPMTPDFYSKNKDIS